MILKNIVEKMINEVSAGDVLGKAVRDSNDQILLNADIILTEKHLKRLCEQNIENLSIVQTIKYSPEKMKKFEEEFTEILKIKFKSFEEGKKKDFLIKLFLDYKMSRLND